MQPSPDADPGSVDRSFRRTRHRIESVSQHNILNGLVETIRAGAFEGMNLVCNWVATMETDARQRDALQRLKPGALAKLRSVPVAVSHTQSAFGRSHAALRTGNLPPRETPLPRTLPAECPACRVQRRCWP